MCTGHRALSNPTHPTAWGPPLPSPTLANSTRRRRRRRPHSRLQARTSESNAARRVLGKGEAGAGPCTAGLPQLAREPRSAYCRAAQRRRWRTQDKAACATQRTRPGRGWHPRRRACRHSTRSRSLLEGEKRAVAVTAWPQQPRPLHYFEWVPLSPPPATAACWCRAATWLQGTRHVCDVHSRKWCVLCGQWMGSLVRLEVRLWVRRLPSRLGQAGCTVRRLVAGGT